MVLLTVVGREQGAGNRKALYAEDANCLSRTAST